MGWRHGQLPSFILYEDFVWKIRRTLQSRCPGTARNGEESAPAGGLGCRETGVPSIDRANRGTWILFELQPRAGMGKRQTFAFAYSVHADVFN